MMKPWRIHRFLDIKLEIDHPHENVGHGCNDSRTAGRSDNQKELSVLEHDGRRHSGKWTLARSDCIRRTLNEPEGVGDALFGGEVVHFVVEQKPQPFGSHARAERFIERSCHRDRVAVGINYGIVGRVLGFRDCCRERGYPLEFAEDQRALEVFTYARVVRIDGFAPGGGVLFINKLRHRHFCEVGIAHEVGAIVEGAAERFDCKMNGIAGTIAKFREIEAFQNIEYFDERDSAGGWRRSADDVVSAIRSANRLAILGEALKGAHEFGLLKYFARLIVVSVAQENAFGFGKLGEVLISLQVLRVFVSEGETIAR